MSSKKAEARERVKAMREEQARKDRARERMMRFGIAGAVLVGIAIIAVAVISNRGGDEDGPVEVPEAAISDEEGILVGDADAAVTITNWMDFLCPHCRTFEETNAALIDGWVEAGEVNVVYNPVTYTGGVNSGRANNALACAADEGMADEFVKGAFAQFQQWTNNSLVSLGSDLGIGGDYASCVRDGTYSNWSSAMTQAARDAGIQGTPTIFVNDQPVEDWSPEGLTAAVQAAAGGEVDDEAPDDDAADDGADEDGDTEDDAAEDDDDADADED
ncbi:DsbA family protein [Phytoactinopolyspora mesophila]|uniref:Thioredoxin domain-containing protein n=1 Tax=Phytoactinopolyspora mesophila TaxID=2650750 RepID=A0A7K3LX99_9ACTN|nr:thioredoxin domain-containing protein [Phytoactinopolyspora mesophila]NDL55467.1 thioredoxin domain-containing protein [Phytoactinopolyspora mesophila]